MQTEAFTADDGENLTLRCWRPEGEPRAIVQIAHGAAEHLRRYDRLARRLNETGYAVIGADHRGHGDNSEVHGLGEFGPRGFAGVVDDMAAVTRVAVKLFGERPVVLLGHSLGSFASQAYLLDHANALSGLVLSGTAALDRLFASRASGGGLKRYNAAFEPARTDFDWLSRDEAEVDLYIADPLCGFDIKPGSMATVGETAMGASRDPRLATARRLPVYVISGEVDPIVGPDQAFAEALIEGYRQAGITDVEHRVYPQGRHEMFNETNRDEVMTELIAWLDAHV